MSLIGQLMWCCAGASSGELSAVVWDDWVRCLGCTLDVGADDVSEALDSCRELSEQALIQQLTSNQVRIAMLLVIISCW